VVAAIAVAAAIVALEGCVDTVPLPSSSPSAAVKTTFGRDTVGVQTETLQPAGTYRLALECTGSGATVSLMVAGRVAATHDADCARPLNVEVRLTGSEPVEMYLEVVAEADTTGEATLYRLA